MSSFRNNWLIFQLLVTWVGFQIHPLLGLFLLVAYVSDWFSKLTGKKKPEPKKQQEQTKQNKQQSYQQNNYNQQKTISRTKTTKVINNKKDLGNKQ